MVFKKFFNTDDASTSSYTSKEILELRGAKIFIAVTAGTSALGILFQFLAGHRFSILLPALMLYTLAIYFSYRLYLRKKRRANSIYYALIVGTIMFLIPLIARYNYALSINWLYAAQSNHINWLLMANLVAFQFLYSKKLYIFMICFVLLNVCVFYLLAFYNGVNMPFFTYTQGRVNYGVMSSREIYTILMMCIVAYLSYRNIPEVEEFDSLTSRQEKVIREQGEEQARIAEEVQSQYEELEAQYEEIEQMNEEMNTAQHEILDANNNLVHEKEKLLTTLRSVAQGIIEVGINLNVNLINDGALAIAGISRENAMGKHISQVLKVRKNNGEQVVLSDGNFLNGETVFDFYNSAVIESGGEMRDIILRSSPVKLAVGKVYGYVIAIEDVTELKKMKEHIINSSKLESLGIFAGGIAHDINNFFTGMLGCITLARNEIAVNRDAALKYLEDAEATALKARGLAEQLLTFSKGGEPLKKNMSIREVLELSADFIFSGTKITCCKNFDENLMNIEADESQLSQVINNILINASQVMQDGGTVSIRAINVLLDGTNPYLLPAGDYVSISIEDEGPGISPEVASRIFDPFFTTKCSGSGLGLSVAYSVVKKHNGAISVSNGSKGAIFTVILPAVERTGKVQEHIKSESILLKGRVLLMDDDPVICMVGQKLLESLGLDVETAGDGDAAVNIFREKFYGGIPFNLVIFDLTIKGGTGGIDAFNEIKKIDSSVRGVVSSGYSTDPVMSNFREYGFSAVLKKPYNYNELSAVMNNLFVHQ